MTRACAVPPETLLAQEDFVRGLAHSLIGDRHRADDVVQQAWLAALERPPHEPRALRSWLGSVVRNAATNDRAADRARARRERDSARAEAVPSVEEVLSREALRRSVVEAVLALPEPYRNVVLLRYYEELEPRQIAARLGIPRATARTRLHRGLEMLRQQLDRHGDRRSWLVALIPLARPGPSAATTAATVGANALAMGGLLVQKTTWTLAAAALVLAAMSIWLWRDSDVARATPSPAQDSTAMGVVPSLPPIREDQPPDAAAPTRSPSTPAAVEANPPMPRVAEPPADPLLRGIVRYADGRPAGSLMFWLEWGDSLPRGNRPRVPTAAPRTGPDGSWTASSASNRKGFLWFELGPTILAAFSLPRDDAADTTLWLPRLAEFHLASTGLRPDDTWDLVVRPRWQSADGAWVDGHHRTVELNDRRPGRATALVLSRERHREQGNNHRAITLAAGLPYSLQCWGSGLEFSHKSRAITAPGQLTLQVAKRFPAVSVVVLEPNGQRAVTVSGRLVIASGDGKRHTYGLARGRGVVGLELEPGSSYQLWALLDNGELFATTVVGSGDWRPIELTFQRGQGTTPVLIFVRSGPEIDATTRIVLDCPGGKLVEGARADPWAPPGEGFAFRVVSAREIQLVGAPADWQAAWILNPDGATAKADMRARGRIGVARDLTSKRLRPIDLQRLRQQRRAPTMTAFFDLRLPSTSGEPSWVTIDTAELTRLSGEENVWHKRLPGRLEARLRIRVSGRPEETVPIRR